MTLRIASRDRGADSHLVGTGVVEVLALEVDLGTTKLLRETLRVEDGRGAADIGRVQLGELLLEVLALDDRLVLVVSAWWQAWGEQRRAQLPFVLACTHRRGNLVHRRLKVGRDELATVLAEHALGIRHRRKLDGSGGHCEMWCLVGRCVKEKVNNK